MDDDKYKRQFSRSIVSTFFEQAEQTFAKMEDALYVSAKEQFPSTSKSLMSSIGRLVISQDFLHLAIS